MELVQLRWNAGSLEYRQRLVDMNSNGFLYIRGNEWGPWQKVPGVTGDESDKRFD